MTSTVETIGPVEMLREQPVTEAVWGCATYFFEITHPGAGAVVEWTYRAVQAVLSAQPVETGTGYDLTVDLLPTPVSDLCFAFRIRDLPPGATLLPDGGLMLDVSFFAMSDETAEPARPWHDYRSRIASTEPDAVLEHVVVRPAGTPLTALADAGRDTTRWALRVALDRTGMLQALGMRRGDAPN